MHSVLSSASDLDVRPLSRVFRALGDETRLRIVALLAHGELCVCHVEQALGLSQPNASRQLGILRSAGLVDSRRDGTWVSYRLVEQHHDAVARLLALLTDSLTTRRALQTDLVRLRKRCGPDACK
jgi:ArsR family transcriptional regulator, arsenate/arsenite/antimonite-responsive transcriptional repressor